MTGPVDVVHATTIITPGHRAPLVVTLHDLAWRHEGARFTRRGVRFFERGLELVRQEARLVLCSSRTTIKRLPNFSARTSRAGRGRVRLTFVVTELDSKDPEAENRRLEAAVETMRSDLDLLLERGEGAGGYAHAFSRKDDHDAQNKTARQDQRGRGGHVTLAEPVPAPIER